MTVTPMVYLTPIGRLEEMTSRKHIVICVTKENWAECYFYISGIKVNGLQVVFAP